MVCDDTHAHIVILICAIAATRKFRGDIQDGSHLVNLVHVGDALLEEGNSFHAHAGVDILLWQLADDVKVHLAADVLNRILHEHEVPDLEISSVIDRGTPIGAELRTAVKVNF